MRKFGSLLVLLALSVTAQAGEGFTIGTKPRPPVTQPLQLAPASSQATRCEENFDRDGRLVRRTCTTASAYPQPQYQPRSQPPRHRYQNREDD